MKEYMVTKGPMEVDAAKGIVEYEDSCLEICSSDKVYGLSDVKVSKFDHYLAIIVFCAFGTSQLLIWNLVLQFYSSMGIIWPNTTNLFLLGGVEHGAAILAAFIMFKFDVFSVRHTLVWSVVNVTLFFLFPLIPQFFSGPNDGNIASGLLISVSGFFGLSSGFLHIFAYAFAAILPFNYTGYVSTGNGIAGVYSFVFYLMLQALFPATKRGQVELCWTFFLLGAAASLVLLTSFWILSHKKWFKECIVLSRVSKEANKEKHLKEHGERRSVVEVFKDCWVHTLSSAFLFFSTLMLFPSVGPYSWRLSITMTTILNGVFQVVDLLTRLMPMVGQWTHVREDKVWIFVALRPVIFVVLFLIPAKSNLPFFGNSVWLVIVMGVFTVTNGWLITLASMYAPETVSHPEEKEIVVQILVMSILIGVTAGIFASVLFTHVWPNYIAA